MKPSKSEILHAYIIFLKTHNVHKMLAFKDKATKLHSLKWMAMGQHFLEFDARGSKSLPVADGNVSSTSRVIAGPPLGPRGPNSATMCKS